MKMNVTKEVAAMRRMTVRELKGRYVEVFGEQARTGNKDYLVKRKRRQKSSQRRRAGRRPGSLPGKHA